MLLFYNIFFHALFFNPLYLSNFSGSFSSIFLFYLPFSAYYALNFTIIPAYYSSLSLFFLFVYFSPYFNNFFLSFFFSLFSSLSFSIICKNLHQIQKTQNAHPISNRIVVVILLIMLLMW